MEHYNNFEVDDFVWDSYFRQWVLAPTRESHADWDRWLQQNPDRAAIATQAREVVLALRVDEQVLAASEIEAVVKETLSRIKSPEGYTLGQKSRQVAFRRWWVAAAASVLLLAAFAWLARNRQGVKDAAGSRSGYQQDIALGASSRPMVEKSNGGTSPMLVRLSDGSRITLMKGSRITYPQQFESAQREVSLIGEAFFDIAKDPERPFLVYANELVTKVLGTSFLIKAYPASPQVTVEVKTGRVSVSTKTLTAKNRREAEGVILSPNQKVIFEREEIRMVKTLVEAPEVIVPKASAPHFLFEDTPVSDAFDMIAAAYGIDIIYDEEVLAGCPLTAMLDTQPLHEKLSIICRAVEATYEIVDGQIIIHSKGCKN